MEVKLHDIGEGMTEAHVSHFFVKAGDSVKADQPLVEVQTDKMTAEIPSPAAGTIKEILVSEGTTIEVGTVVLVMEAAQITKQRPEKTQENKEARETVAAAASSSNLPRSRKRILAAPYTRKIAREQGVDITKIEGTGAAGRITDEDVMRFVEGDGGSPSDSKEVTETVLAENKPAVSMNSESIPFRGRRKQIGMKMKSSLMTIPHCTHFEEIDVTNMMLLRNQLKQADTNISASAFFVKALSIALKEFPIFNARVDEEKEQITFIKDHNIGVATDTEDGLIVPVVKNVESKSLKTIHSEMKASTLKARENKLVSREVTGGTFTISNVGPMGGSIGATPIINHPEVALVSFHKTKKRPMVNEKDKIVIRSMMNISMSFDHRAADGATAVAFTNRFAELIENPNLMIVELM
ncbi:2-oxo acid dehydrogenase subunit E2 [Rossellomorea vietnamensis]|uniref:Dihydrolipoamide acetyltransferase component of pyruvate dehydrogenase complex n=2 Tax=Rossellomorea TaxID=2837508 RepID=A0A5D4KGB5_9BACI|nr:MULTISPECIES: dihydrolipoamide acetyltransferase family protein [Rossellomorea]TYR75735.1 2-oxo acid dehydrogenase subunit E2 [Rossellomorea vietnamensis]TYS80939.1 2-oxo acid dehydrogenase subunit E2 [Rossellomorea aquimaris]